MIQILGLPGIGKSSLVRSALKYIYERKIYLSGIVFVQIKGIREFDRLLREIVIQIQKKKKQAEPCIFSALSIDTQIEESIKLINKLTAGDQSSNKRFLLIVDNAEEITEHAPTQFRALIAQLLNECSFLNIVLTSRRPIGNIQDTHYSQIQLVHALKAQASVELFLERTVGD